MRRRISKGRIKDSSTIINIQSILRKSGEDKLKEAMRKARIAEANLAEAKAIDELNKFNIEDVNVEDVSNASDIVSE